MTGDDKAPMPRGQIAGGILMLVGLLAIVGAMGSSFSKPASTTVEGAILYLGMLVVIIGLVMCAASWVVRKQAEGGDLILARVDAVNEVTRQLTAAPTVNLIENRREMRAMQASIEDAVEATALVHSKAVVEQTQKALEPIERLLADVKQAAAAAYIDSLGDNPPALRAVPPPRGRWTPETS